VAVGNNRRRLTGFFDLLSVEDFRRCGDRVRALTGGILIEFKLPAQHIEENMEFAVQAGDVAAEPVRRH